MENTIVEESKVVAEKIVAVPVAAGTVVVEGTEALARDVGHGIADAVDVAVGITKTVLRGNSETGAQDSRDGVKEVSTTPVVTKPGVESAPV